MLKWTHISSHGQVSTPRRNTHRMPEERTSQSFGNVPQGSEPFRSVPNDSESFRTVPKGSETFGTVPNPSAAFRTVPNATERRPNHTLTVRDAAKMFEAAGVARTERSIVNWCQPNKTGIARLDSYYDPNERRYYITVESVSLAIQEEQSKAARGILEPASELDDAPEPARAERDEAAAQAQRDSLELPAEVKRLKQENYDLQINNRAKDYFIEQLQKEREGFAVERQGYVEKLMAFNHQLGTLQSELLRLSAPRDTSPQQPEVGHTVAAPATESSPVSTP